MSASTTRHVVFFGSVAVSVVGYDVHNADIVANLERHNAFVKLRTTVTAPSRTTQEVLGAVATSPPYEIRTTRDASPTHQGGHHQHQHSRRPHHHRQRGAFLPVMMEVAAGVQLNDLPSLEEVESALPPPASADGLAQLNSGTALPLSPASASLRIEVDITQSGGRTGAVGLQEVALPSLNYMAAHDICTLVRIPLLTSAIERSAVGGVDAAAVAKECAQLQQQQQRDESSSCRGVAVQLYVAVRVVSLAEKVRIAVEADAAMAALLDPPPTLPVSLSLTQRSEVPYGAMPLTELYRHYRHFCEACDGHAMRHGDATMRLLVAAPRQREAEASYPYRWNALTDVDLRPLLLGERGFAPLLLTLAHCTNLRTLHADGNQLGDITCGRLAALFRRHRYLAHVGLSKNAVHEAGAAQLLRLLRHNPRLSSLTCEGNFFSLSMLQRIRDTAARNAAVITNDPLNVFAPSYGYLTDLASLPESTVRQALRTWAMLSAAPVGDVDVMVRNTTTSSQRTIGDSPHVAMQRAKMALQARETFSFIPPAALAPLLNEVMRTVYVSMARLLPDPLVRSLFADVESVVARQQEQHDAQAEGADVEGSTAGGGVGSASRTASALPAEVAAALGGPHDPQVQAEKLYARSFLRVVVIVFRKLMLAAPWADIAAELEGVGRMHRDLGVMAEDYWLAVHVFMAAVRISCGAESYDADHASSFLAILALAVRTTAGFDVQLE